MNRKFLKYLLFSFAFGFLVFNSDPGLAKGDRIAEEHYQKGLSFYQAGEYKKAEEEFEKAIEKTKKTKDFHYQKGVMYYEKGEYKKAEAEFKKALDATEQENDQHYRKGLILYNQGKYAEAHKEFQKAISEIKKEKADEIAKPVQQADAGKADENEVSLPPERSTYLINNGDVLDIKVWQHPDLADQLLVRPDGMISFPLVGEMKAADKTISQFREDLADGLREFIKYPQVSVSVSTFGGNRVIILGQVRSPGVYTISNGKTVLEAIGLAGGFTEDAVTPSVMLVKGGFQNPVPRRLDLNKALKKADLADNLVLEAEDMIYVPRRFIKDVNYFLKAFLDPVASGLYIRRELRNY
jgi:polysaccharide export outer membrane protein